MANVIKIPINSQQKILVKQNQVIHASEVAGVYAEQVKEYASKFNFPNVGKKDFIYIDKADNATYRWDVENTKYYLIGEDVNNIKVINGGNADVE